jgi:rhodanese-related sulfurtransferase
VILLAVIVVLIAACTGTVDESSPSTAPASVAALDPAGFAPLLDDPDVTVVNVHVPYQGELRGTDALAAYDRILEWEGLPQDRDATLALYCMSGNMSRQAASALIEAGYTDVRELDGGMLAWQDAGRELITPDASEAPGG